MTPQIFETSGAVLRANKRSLKRAHADKFDMVDPESQLPINKEIDFQVKKFPYFIITISIVQVLLFIFERDETCLIFWYDPYRRHELWRYFTYMLVHKTLFTHLLMNVIIQLIFGLPLEIFHNWQRISVIYMSGVVGGSLASTVITPNQYMLGASAGVYGLLLATVATIILNWNHMDWKFTRLFGSLAVVICDNGMTLYYEFVSHVHLNVCHAAHFGGALAGFITAVFVLRKCEKLAWQKKFQKVLLVLVVVSLLIVLIINLCFPGHYLASEFNFNYKHTLFIHLIKSPEWAELEEICLADLECAAFYAGDFNNNSTLETEN